MAKIFLRKKITGRIAKGHPSIFANEIGDESGSYRPGDIVSVYSSNGSFVGKGFINPSSQIRVRLLTRKEVELVDEELIFNRIRKAWHLRQKLGYQNNCRVVFSDSDRLPGLIVDKFEEVLVFQTLSLGMDLWKESIVGTLRMIFDTRKIYEKNTAPVRTLEGLPMRQGFVLDQFQNPLVVAMDQLPFYVDIIDGLRTGFFWEQRTIAAALSSIVPDADILDIFCCTGFVGLKLLHQGAGHVTGFDNDKRALALAKKNAAINQREGALSLVEGNSFDLLKKYSQREKQYGAVILDPPALGYSRQQSGKVAAAYKELNLRALKLVSPGGFLLTTCSASLLSEDGFSEQIQEAAKDCSRRIRVVAALSQPADHPVAWHIPSTRFFKGFLLNVD